MRSPFRYYRQLFILYLFRLLDASVGAISLNPVKKLSMQKANLDHLPTMPLLPKGYELRTAMIRDEKQIASLLHNAYTPFWPAFRARYILLDADDVKRTYVITYNNNVVATASARVVPRLYDDSGYMHWVAVSPEHRRKGLGYTVSLAVLHAFKEMKCKSAILETDVSRSSAINLYLKLGFEPVYKYQSQKVLWKTVLQQ